MKKAVKSLLLVCLAVLMLVPMFGCGDEVISEFALPQHYKNIIYYFRQGFKEEWTLSGEEDGTYADEEHDLIITVTQNADPDSGRYMVYKQKEHDDIPMTSSLKSIYQLVANPDHALYFNTKMGEREEFEITNAEPIDVVINGRQYYSATYTFTENGKAWQGQFFVLPDSRQYYVVAYEATTDKWATFEPEFKELHNDFAPTGFESDNSIS